MRLWKRRSVRFRLAALLTALFVLLGATLLGISYALVRSNLSVDPHDLAETAAQRLGIELRPDPGGELGPADLHESLRRQTGGRGDDLSNGALRAAAEERRLILTEIRDVQEELANDALRELTLQYLAFLAAMALLSAALGWFVSGRVLRPVSEITATARKVSRESLHERIALEGPDDELKQLADTFDSMLARLEAAFERESAFVRNASHELRTPLSVIRTEADVSLSEEANDPEALRRSLEAVREASERSERLIDALLTLARADRGDHPRTQLDLGEIVRQLTDETNLDGLQLDLDLRPAQVVGDRELLRTMAANLIDNAVRHNSPDGWMEIRTECTDEQARLEISNSGPITSHEDAVRLREPFRRLRPARTGDGLGLGLSIAESVVQAHGGQLLIDPLERGGLRVSIALPVALVDQDRSDGEHLPSHD
jgi:signal transduction histidine kinase